MDLHELQHWSWERGINKQTGTRAPIRHGARKLLLTLHTIPPLPVIYSLVLYSTFLSAGSLFPPWLSTQS